MGLLNSYINYHLSSNLSLFQVDKGCTPLQTSSTMKNDKICAVCFRPAYCCHFGAVSCDACAAFFRRAVPTKRSFTCINHGKCIIDFFKNRVFCRACRLQKCISVGMQESAVLSLGLPRKRKVKQTKQQNQHSSVLTVLRKFDYDALFSPFQNNSWLQNLLLVNRVITHQRTAILRPAPYQIGKKSFMPDMDAYVPNESQFCQVFLTATGITDIAKDVVDEKITNVILYWSVMTTVLNTLHYDSIQDRKLTLIDHSMVGMSEASIREMYATQPPFRKHFNTLVNTALPMWYRTEELINQIRSLGMTKEEQAVFLTLGMIENITQLSSSPKVTSLRVKPLRDIILRSMKTYYTENFANDWEVRMGEIIMALPLMNEMYNLFNEHRIVISLCNGITENYAPANLLKAFHSQFHVKTDTENE